ncbi:MAG: TRAP transporter substrate-binding protein DctP [Planctomycetota bacterium]
MKMYHKFILILIGFIFFCGALDVLFGEDEEAQLLKFGTLAPDNTPWSAILENFKKLLQKETKDLFERGEIKDRLKVKLYLNGIKGDEKAMLEQIRYQKLTGGGFSTGGMSSVAPELQVFEVPFLFNNDAEADYIMDKVVLKDMEEALTKRGLFLYCWAINGWYDFGSKTKMLSKPSNIVGTKMYTQESPIQTQMYETLGIKPIPLAVTDVLSSLQTNMVDSYSSTPIYALAGQWFTETKYWVDSNHVFQPAAVVFGNHWWQPLDQKVKNVILKFQGDLQSAARKDVRAADDPKFASRDDEIMARFQEKDVGIKVEKLSASQREEFQKATQAVAQEMIKQKAFSQELWDKIQKGLQEFRSKK